MAHPVVENLAARAKLQVLKGSGRNRRLPCAHSRTNYRSCDRVADHGDAVVANQRRFSNDNESARSTSDFRCGNRRGRSHLERLTTRD